MNDLTVPILTAIGAGIAVLSMYIRSARARAVYAVVLQFADLATAYYRMAEDGWTATEKEALADLTIGFFNAAQGAGAEIRRP